MSIVLSERIQKTKPSFIREILKVTESDDIISFAGGLPNPISFPTVELNQSVNHVIERYGDKVFQYSTTEGYRPLREWVADRYRREQNLDVDADDIIITTGSQQGLDLMGKILIDRGDALCLERPGYLGAIQAFSLFEPNFIGIDLSEDGIDVEQLERVLSQNHVKLLYTVPNFQNPTGLTYSARVRKEVRELLKRYDTVLIEDDPYGELRFEGDSLPYIGAGELRNSVLFGSVSKIITPGVRIGWICTKNEEIKRNVIIAKQASDLHSNILSQYFIHDYLMNNELDTHIQTIRDLYRKQSRAMVEAIDEYFPKEVTYTRPQGGMFMWAELPKGESASDLFDRAIKEKVAFVPGDPFYTDCTNVNTLRLNYTNSDVDRIREGIRRLASVM
ncbi:MAG TPA: PLP-dependent aminotransferase family protein [Lachnospiraceae bacterium]|nr:PLP-dependent aminotransferase family protein [Lachnospiraceae bacterium]